MTSPAEHYNTIPYESYAQPQTHPARLAAIGTLFGMEPCPPERARVLEVGCAGAGNLLPMAAALPGAHFTGVDPSTVQIAQGQAGVDALSLTNVSLHAIGLEEMDEAFGTFDYILASGVYSWVSGSVREQLMAQCARLLRPQGIVCIGFNALPGAQARLTLRGMALHHTRRTTDLRTRVQETRDFFTFLRGALRHRTDAWARLLMEELSPEEVLSDFYIAHEYLENHNDPCYLHEFVSHAGRHGLQYLGDAEIQTMSTGDFPAEVRQQIHIMAAGMEDAEQYADFLRNRAFRQTLLCRGGMPLKRSIPPSCVQRFHFASSLADTARKSLGIRDSLTLAALAELSRVWPAALPFDELLTRATARAGIASTPSTVTALAMGLLTCSSSTPAVELQLHPPVFQSTLTDFPKAWEVSRWQATNGPRVTSRRHENVLLSPPEKDLLLQLDGTRPLATLEQDSPQARSMLEHFARAALLVS